MNILPNRYFKTPSRIQEYFIKDQIPRKRHNAFFLFNEKIAKKNYSSYKTKCLCADDNDILISTKDRYRCEFHLVLCKSCGLIRAKTYWKDEYVEDFYKNHYRKIWGVEDVLVEENYNNEGLDSKYIWKTIDKFLDLNELNKKYILADIGGGGGGALDLYRDKHECILCDYDERLLKYAETKNIKSFKGGINQLFLNNIFPDVIILSHVIEHWNNFEEEISNLIKCLKKETLIYIEVPGLNRSSEEPYFCDFLGDIHIPHFYYFSLKVFKNLFERFGFEVLFIDEKISAILKYTGNKKNTKNFFADTLEILKKNEARRRQVTIIYSLKKIVKYILRIKN